MYAHATSMYFDLQDKIKMNEWMNKSDNRIDETSDMFICSI